MNYWIISIIFIVLAIIFTLAWVGSRFFLGQPLPWVSVPALASAVRRYSPSTETITQQASSHYNHVKQAPNLILNSLRHVFLRSQFTLLLFTAIIIGVVIATTLHFKGFNNLKRSEVDYQYGERIAQSFADETLAPPAPLPPAVFTVSVTRQTICPQGKPNCDISSQLNSYFVAAANKYQLEPALLAAIQQCEAPITNPAIVGPAPAEGDINDRAIGLMQIRQSIARKLGMDPANPEQAIFAAAQLLAESLKRNHGDLAKAVTEYHGGTNPANWGPKTAAYVSKVFLHLHTIRAQSAELARPAANHS